MPINKDIAIQKIEKEFERFSNLVLEQMSLLNSLFSTNLDKVHKKINKELARNEGKIDNYEVLLEDEIIKAVVLYQPVASDLRRLFAIYHMTINLERVGDLVKKITLIYLDMKGTELIRETDTELKDMLKLTSEMVNNALLSFINNDTGIASITIRSDSKLDELNRTMFKKTLKASGLSKDSRIIVNNLADMRAILSSMERIGDHATNIAESSIYAISGANIRHNE